MKPSSKAICSADISQKSSSINDQHIATATFTKAAGLGALSVPLHADYGLVNQSQQVGRIFLQTVITPRKELPGSIDAFEALTQQLVSWEVTLKAAHPEIDCMGVN